MKLHQPISVSKRMRIDEKNNYTSKKQRAAHSGKCVNRKFNIMHVQMHESPLPTVWIFIAGVIVAKTNANAKLKSNSSGGWVACWRIAGYARTGFSVVRRCPWNCSVWFVRSAFLPPILVEFHLECKAVNSCLSRFKKDHVTLALALILCDAMNSI